MSRQNAWIVAFTLLCVLAAFLLPAVRQPLDYHDFADRRVMLGIPHFLNVASNVGFLLAGLLGLVVVVKRSTAFGSAAERWPYAVFFFGLILTAAGSTYYHLDPNNESLFWDRLPITIAFMALLSAQIVDRISVRLGLALLAPLLLVGAASVYYWLATERMGAGNVLPYGVLQGYSVVVLVLLALLKPSRYTRGNDVYYMFAWYALSKVFETFDAQVFALGNFVSGHTLKHLAAAVPGFVACYMLSRRTHKEQANLRRQDGAGFDPDSSQRVAARSVQG